MAQAEAATIRTSKTHPLRIAEIPTFAGAGLIGVTFCPGKVQDGMTGRWERDLVTDLDVIAAWNAAVVVTLVEDHELTSLKVSRLGEEVRRRNMEWLHLPTEDECIPDELFSLAWPVHSERLQSILKSGSNVLIHCKGGLGRAGTIAARLLVEIGAATPDQAMETVRDVRPGSIEDQQESWVRQGGQSKPTLPSTASGAIRDRAVGALVGLAVGDALGTTLEFKPKPDLAVLDDMVGGGPFRLKPGQWTDDTAMALALADSLINDPDLDPSDLVTRFVDWADNGTYSCTGECFDIGNTVSAALSRFEQTGDPIAGSTDPNSAGNGALMRLSPVAVRHWNSPEKLKEVAALQTRTTHGAAEAVDASILFNEILAEAIHGRPMSEVLRPRSGTYAGRVYDAARGTSWRGKHRNDIRCSGYVIHSLEAALWAVSRTTCFRSAVLLAANLGEDADTTAAIAGQLAGALYGLSGIPEEWLAKLAWRERLVATAEALFDASLSSL